MTGMVLREMENPKHSKRRAPLQWILALVPACVLVLQIPAIAEDSGSVLKGVVRDETGPVSGAVVRIQTTQHYSVSGPDGSFGLDIPGLVTGPVKITASAKGYFIAGPVEALPGEEGMTILLQSHSRQDNAAYAWLPSLKPDGSGEGTECSECHSRGEGASTPLLPVDEWKRDAHSQSAVNPRFLSLHTGTDLSGRRSPFTRYQRTNTKSIVPLPPDPEKPYYGPGLRLDNPDHTGNCSACHAPVAAVDNPNHTDPVTVRGVGREGVNCDFCHKIWNVLLDPATGLPSPERPGVLSYEFRRPPEGHQFFAGPLDDVAPGEDTYSGLQKSSRFCAPCHFGVFWDTVVYDSYGEWLRSPYSREGTGQTCQECHMRASGAEFFALPEKGGLRRSPESLVNHTMPGARDLELLQNAVTLTLEAERTPGGIRVRTEIVNDRTGHHVPTDSPLRHLILVVRAYGDNDAELPLKEGPVLPDWCGIGNPADGNYAGLAGKVFIKLLEEIKRGVSPTAAYWNPTRIVMDTRLAAFESDVGEYLFEAPDSGDARIEAVLLYRRAYKELMDQKGWEEPDIVMESATIKSGT